MLAVMFAQASDAGAVIVALVGLAGVVVQQHMSTRKALRDHMTEEEHQRDVRDGILAAGELRMAKLEKGQKRIERKLSRTLKELSAGNPEIRSS